MNIDNIQRLIDLLNESPGITELAVTAPDGAKVALRRSFAMPPVSTDLAVSPAPHLDMEEVVVYEPGPVSAQARPPMRTVTATIVGIFHCANPPLGYGASVSAGQIVGYIESMKLMNEVMASHSGTVAEVFIDENLPVEYGQPLFDIAMRSEE